MDEHDDHRDGQREFDELGDRDDLGELHELGDLLIDDDELAALALAADPTVPLGDDAVPFRMADAEGLLPEWYMPAPQARQATPMRRVVFGVVIVSMLLLNGAGLCVTNGWVEIAW